MPETPDLKALAERYLDLWEEQFATAAADPALAAAMAAWLGPWRTLAAGAVGDVGRKTDDGPAQTVRGTPRASGRAAAAAAASRDGGGGLERILEQLQRIERRLDALERQRKGERKRTGKGRGAGAGARKGRSNRAG